jgi:hypothetical protein
MDRAAVRRAYDDQIRRGPPTDPDVAVEVDGPVIRQVSASPDGWAGVAWSDLLAPGAGDPDEVIATQIRSFAGRGRSFEWTVYGDDEPPDLGDRLARAGLVAGATEAVVVAEVAVVTAGPAVGVPGTPGLGRRALPAGIELRPVTDEAGVTALVAVHDEVFGGDHASIGRRLSASLRRVPESVAAVVAMAGDRPVAAGRMELHPLGDFASLWGGGTVEHWRGQGLYQAIVGQRAAIAAARGYRYLHVDALPASERILLRLGFERLTTATPYEWE